MTVRRIVPDIRTDSREPMSAGGVGRGVITEERTAPVVPDLSVEVEDVDAVYAQVVAAGVEIVRDLRDEEWGVRRFFVRDPNGRVVNVLTHRR